MCKAFSAVVDRNGKVYWKRGMDSHEDIKKHFKLDDSKPDNLMPVEISPKNKDYLKPDEWVFVFDEQTPHTPDWWKASHENACWAAFRKWKKEGASTSTEGLPEHVGEEGVPPSGVAKKKGILARFVGKKGRP